MQATALLMSLEGQDNVVRTQILGPRDWSSQFTFPICYLLELKEDRQLFWVSVPSPVNRNGEESIELTGSF